MSKLSDAVRLQDQLQEAIDALMDEHGWSRADVRKEVEAILKSHP